MKYKTVDENPYLSTLKRFWIDLLLNVKNRSVYMGYSKLKEYQKSNFNGVYARNNLYKIKDGAHIINLDE